MKIITKADLIFICLGAMTILDMRVKASHLKRKTHKVSSNIVYYPKDPSLPLKPIGNYLAVFPEISQKIDPTAVQNAILHTKAARIFLLNIS